MGKNAERRQNTESLHFYYNLHSHDFLVSIMILFQTCIMVWKEMLAFSRAIMAS
jgi:hypothetical protein